MTDVLPAIEGFVSDVDRRLAERFDSVSHPRDCDTTPLYNELITACRQRFLTGGGKRVRPRLVYHFGTIVDSPREALLDIAAAAELVHAGSLLHDDVVDQASRRRGEPAVRLIAGDRASVLVGDVMITLAIHLLRPWGSDVVVDAVDTVTHMSRGALLETTSRGFLERSTERWRSVVAGKTGSLFAFCGKAASRLGRLRNGSDPAKSFGDCGMSLGVAFQLADDLLDLWPEDSGKDRFADLRNRECTYPIVSEAQHNAEFAKGVEALWAHETPPEKDVERLGLALMAGRGPRDTLEQISAEINASLDALAPYRSRPEGDTLARWAESMQARASDMLGTLQQAANPARRQSLG